jgi:hypothetical protein
MAVCTTGIQNKILGKKKICIFVRFVSHVVQCFVYNILYRRGTQGLMVSV